LRRNATFVASADPSANARPNNIAI